MSKWHVFYVDEDGIIGVDMTPCDGESILVYWSNLNLMRVEEWDDDEWSEYGSIDGDPMEPGDAWMELPNPPGEETTQSEEQQQPTDEELIAHYGKRYKCRKCGLEWYQQVQKYCQHCGTAVRF